MAVNLNNLKQTPIPVVPRTMKIVNADGTITRSGQLLLEQLQAPSVTEGTHAARPNAADVADGALYVENDRGVVYYNDNGVWKYLTGTMWGTLSPDQRPTDLGSNDAGFVFRSTDYGREFIWNGTAWIEATLVRWGTHAQRLALVLTRVIDQELYVESDRSDVVYQNHGGVWQYVTGTMVGTMSPDQRPTDLGTHDAGFDFRSTDKPLLQFAWNGSAWVEITGADYAVNGTAVATQTGLNLIGGTNTSISGVNNSATGRVDVTITAAVGTGGAVTSVFGRTGNVAAVNGDYSAALVTNAVDQTGSYANPVWIPSYAWSKITGAPAFLVSPLTTKGDLMAYGTANSRLGVGTDGQILTADSTQSLGVRWGTGPVVPQVAYASSALTLTGAAQYIPGATLTLGPAGYYFLDAVFDFNEIGNDANALFYGYMIAAGAGLAKNALYNPGTATGGRATVTQRWVYHATSAGVTVALQALKSGGAGTSTADTQSSISAVWVSP